MLNVLSKLQTRVALASCHAISPRRRRRRWAAFYGLTFYPRVLQHLTRKRHRAMANTLHDPLPGFATDDVASPQPYPTLPRAADAPFSLAFSGLLRLPFRSHHHCGPLAGEQDGKNRSGDTRPSRMRPLGLLLSLEKPRIITRVVPRH